MTKSKLRRAIYNTLSLDMNRSHYLKWYLNKEWSIRYFFHMASKPELSRQWVLKSHYTKDYIVLSYNEALDYIVHKGVSEYPEEIFSVREGEWIPQSCYKSQ